MRLKLLCEAAGIVCPAEAENLEITSLATDSRRVERGGMFICLRGLHTDGHMYVADAIARGASCILVDRYAQSECDGAITLRCADTGRAASFLYHAWYGFPGDRLRLIGVTGTNGKTSVTYLLRAILEASLHPCGSIGTLGAFLGGEALDARSDDPLVNMTTPDPAVLYRLLAQMVRGGAEYVVMEASSHALALEKLAPLTFEVGIFTNLTPEHLDFHRNMERYAEAKARLFAQSRISVLNADSPYVGTMEKSAMGRCISCGTLFDGADYTARDVELLGREGVKYRLRSVRTGISLTCPIPGSFTVLNSMQAAIAALELGCSPSVIKSTLASLRGVAGRMERVRLGLGADFSVLIDYAHTPDALEGLLGATRELARDGKLTLVFGCGGDRDRSKRGVMGRIAEAYADEVIVTSDNSRSEDPLRIIEEIRRGMTEECRCRVIPDREEAIRFAVANAVAGEVVVLAGKGHEEYEIIGDVRRRFCEREIVADAYRARQDPKKEI